MKKTILSLVFLFLTLIMVVGTFAKQPPIFDSEMLVNLGRPDRMVSNLESYYQHNLLGRTTLRDLHIKLRTMAGYREMNGLYLCQNGLVEAFVPSKDTSIHKKNTESIRDFAQRTDVPTALMVLPTPSAIYQDKLPPYAAEIQYNQQGFIRRLSDQLAGQLAVVDVYPTLFAARSEPLYYRTDSELTSRGSYLAYATLARRLGLSPTPQTSFSQQFLEQPYYGDLYSKWGYSGIRGDTVSFYALLEQHQMVTVEHWLRFENKTYYTLYPTQATVSGSSRDIILGGHSPRITITNYDLNQSAGNLLVLGDRNALGILPFLSAHYSSITYADPSLLTDGELADIYPLDYSQMVVIFSLEDYMNTGYPSRAALLGGLPTEKLKPSF